MNKDIAISSSEILAIIAIINTDICIRIHISPRKQFAGYIKNILEQTPLATVHVYMEAQHTHTDIQREGESSFT